MPFQIIYNDITECIADAIIIPANAKKGYLGKGVDGKIYALEGSKSFDERKEFLDIGEVDITNAYNIKCKYIVHAVSPKYIDGKFGEEELLATCYRNAFDIAYKHECRSVVFPLLSTGVLKFPKDKAKEIAIKACRDFLAEHKGMNLTLVLYNTSNRRKMSLDDAQTYIMENTYDVNDQKNYDYLKGKWTVLSLDLEERLMLDLIEKKLARKRHDEKKRLEYYKKQWNTIHNTHKCFLQKVSFEEFLANYDPSKYQFTFVEVYYGFVSKKFGLESKETTNMALVRRAGFKNSSDLTRMLTGERPVTREKLWKIAFGLTLNLEETEELFNAAGMTRYGRHIVDEKTMRREALYEYFIKKQEYNLDVLVDYMDKCHVLDDE